MYPARSIYTRQSGRTLGKRGKVRYDHDGTPRGIARCGCSRDKGRLNFRGCSVQGGFN